MTSPCEYSKNEMREKYLSNMDSISFPPEVLERIIPDLSLERHVKSGIRPNYRQFHEFKPIEILNLESTHSSTTLYIQNGSTLIIMNISYTISEATNYVSNQFASIYPSISISRGRSTTSAPTDEEINLCQGLYEMILNNKIIPNDSLIFRPFLKVGEEYLDPKDLEFDSSKLYKFNLSMNFKIFSRTGPLFDIIYYSAIEGLKNVKLPMVYTTEDNITLKHQLLVNSKVLNPLNLAITKSPISSNFGIYHSDSTNLILCDIENESEESNIISKSSVISDGDNLMSFNLINGDLLDITKDDLKQLISLSKSRASSYN